MVLKIGLKIEEDTSYLDNMINAESFHYNNILNNPFQKGKERIAVLLLKVLCCRELFEPSFEIDKSQISWYLNQGLGYGIRELRRLKFSDKRIYDLIINSKDNFLKSKGLEGVSYTALLDEKLCIKVYDYVINELEKKLNSL